MARKSSLHIEPTVSVAQVLLHYARVFGLSYAVKNKDDNKTKLYKTPKELLSFLKKIQKDYANHSYRGRRLPSNAKPIREGVVNLKAHHTLKDVEKMAKKIAKKMGIEVLAISVHRDEGKNADNLNYHAHILFNYFDFNTHKIVHHFAKDRIMPQVQDIVAEMLEMERGISKEETKRKHIPHQQWRVIAKEMEAKVEEAKAPLIKNVTELKKKITELSNDLKTANANLEKNEKLFTKEDYQALNKLKKKLNKKTFSEVVENYYVLYGSYQKIIKENQKLKEENERANREISIRDQEDESRTEDRTRSYTELTKSLIQSTDSLEQFAGEHHQAIIEATEDKQATAGAIRLAEVVAESIVRPILETGRVVEKVISYKKIDFLEKQADYREEYYDEKLYDLNLSLEERKTEVNELKSNLAMAEVAQSEKDAQIVNLEDLLSAKENPVANLIEDMKIPPKEMEKFLVKQIIRQRAKVGTDDLGTFIAVTKDEETNIPINWGNSKNEKIVKDSLEEKFTYISEKLSELVDVIKSAAADLTGTKEQSKTKEQEHPKSKTSENKNIASKTPTNTKARTRLKRP